MIPTHCNDIKKTDLGESEKGRRGRNCEANFEKHDVVEVMLVCLLIEDYYIMILPHCNKPS